ncbi:MAG TPA: type VI secretion protein IcmF/TssM N-terminal domain-containing protein [Alphaproteobacteria bacterium]|nr:type VI secretion protein IcmF/TssM N-terminal domain-containing protein [Alphaproteobacteria bacterium]
MDDESPQKKLLVGGLGFLGLGAVAAAVTIPKIGIWVGLAIILFAIIIFGCYFLIQRARKKKKSRDFEGAIEAQTAASPRAISDPNRRAALDKLRQKFQKGMQEFKSRGKDIYKLPWYVIIGEPGSGKTEAIRHSGIDFPPGMQDELQGSGGTVNMDWWFTNRSIILDTAGSMIFNETEAEESPEWLEFLRLLRKARPHSPINGLFLVLSVESLIKDSADKIAKKASRLSQRLEAIKKTLDVRFPVYLLVTKCDLLTGFREFSDNVDDPLLQHQIFGWSNPDPLDTPFKPEHIEQHLKSVGDRIKRRRLSLLREEGGSAPLGDTAFFTSSSFQSGGPKRRLDYVDSLFALPDSMMRLAPRLRRYLETVFVEGEWSAKPVFLRGIYFTSSMREGRALDEAMALATGVPLDQLPEDRDWDKNRSYFMRDLFLDKVFRESGLVTRATNTLALLRQRRLLIMGVAGGAAALLLVMALFSYHSLNKSVMKESSLWRIGADNWNNGEWSSPIIQSGGQDNPDAFTYQGDATLPGAHGMTLLQYQTRLKETVEKRLAISWLFKPMSWMSSGKDLNRKKAQEAIFTSAVLRPLVVDTRNKMERVNLSPDDPKAIARHRDALLSLIRLQADSITSGGSMNGPNAQDAAARYLNSFLSYLTDSNQVADPNLVAIFQSDYSQAGHRGWPPAALLPPNGGDSLAANPAIQKGLNDLNQANQKTLKSITEEVGILNNFADSLYSYEQKESQWLAAGQNASTADIEPGGSLNDAKKTVNQYIAQLKLETKFTDLPLTNLDVHYSILRKAAEDASSGAFTEIRQSIPDTSVTAGIFGQIFSRLAQFRQQAAWAVESSYGERKNEISTLDRDQMAWLTNSGVAHEVRWSFYTRACALADESVPATGQSFGEQWQRFSGYKDSLAALNAEMAQYNGPLKEQVSAACHHIVSQALVQGVSGLQAKIGFPILLSEGQDQPMSADEVKAVKKIVASMSVALSDPAWSALLSDSDQQRMTACLNNCKQYDPVLSALVNDDGSLASVKVFFVPSGTAATMVNVFRDWRVDIGGNQSKWIDLSREIGDSQPLLLNQGTIADGLSISYCRLKTAAETQRTPVQSDSWGLIHLILDGRANRLDDGSGWTVSVAVNDDQGDNGNVMFRIVTDRPLPKAEDWPKR